ncbi:MAG: choice-of-anchor D domain-containing protein, partial [Acidobacteriota bacterium]
SPAARIGAGGTAAIENTIQLGVTQTNLALANSGAVPRVRLVHSAELPGYSEAPDLRDQLNRLVNPSDGVADSVHHLRDQYRADFVKLVVNSPNGGCGYANVMAGSMNPGFEAFAFSITARPCISSNYTFAHELGHNMGCNHAPEDPTTTGAFPYSFGYKDEQRGFRTVMAYSCLNSRLTIPGTGDCPRILQFSNPDRLSPAGLPTGTASQNNARSINGVRMILANFRTSNPSPEIRVTLQPQGWEMFDGGSFAFPATPVDQLPRDQRFEICNDGAGPLVIDNPASMVSGAAFRGIGSVGGTVAPGSCTELRVRFETHSAANHSGAIAIRSNDSNEGTFDVALSGVATSAEPEIRVRHVADGQEIYDGGSFSFPDTVLTDMPISRLFEICNDGTSTLLIYNSQDLVTGTGFLQIGDPPIGQVPPGSCTTTRIRFHTGFAGDFTGVVTILNNDPDEGPFDFTLHGTAVSSQPEIRVMVGPAVLANRSIFTFSSRPVSELPTSQLFTVCNDGGADLIIDNPNDLVRGTGFLQIRAPLDSSIPPGGCSDFRVRFHVNLGGQYAGQIAIGNNDPDDNPFEIFLGGTATEPPPEIRVELTGGAEIFDGGSFTFPTKPLGNLPISRLFSLCNDGAGDLLIYNPTGLVTGVGLVQIGTPPDSPVEPGTCTDFRVRFYPPGVGTFSGGVLIQNNDPDEDDFIFTLGGTAF